jgi:hypothetical protein
MNLQSLHSHKTLRSTAWQWTVSASLVLIGLLIALPHATAAEQVRLKYSLLERSISVDELTKFVETGKASRQLRAYLRDAGQDPERLQELLSDEIEVRQLFLDEVLNSAPGEIILDRLGEFVHTPSGEANRQALRSALVLSAREDDRISLIEILQNYPTQEVHVNGNRLASAYRQIQAIQTSITNVLDVIGLP